MKNIFPKIKKWYSGLPDKKRHIELITAALSVPMMLTVILVNMNNIKAQKEKVETATPTSAPIQVIIDNPTATNSTVTNTKTTPMPLPSRAECKKEIGPIEILSPQEGEIVTSDNVCINISTDGKYCPVTWSYKLGTDSWSDFNNNDICLYNLTPGKKQLQIKIKSTVIDKTITLERNFIYQTSATSTSTSSATLN
ncbi:MAG: hypothetical protein PHE32_01165 [Candidatus Shapirobacteria bacterium]|nr:hypothetical protein [Candidatus Shapirobacteria bacterium]MDD4410301.1 hypothetical protein [Candidatus Shapirobacteria bacterium]